MLLISYGTRPEYNKIKPVMEEMKRNNLPFKTLFTGQHKDIAPKDANYILSSSEGISNNRLDDIMSSILTQMNWVFDCYREITYVLVQGDTSSALAVALSAFHHKKKIIHLEAGLRTYDKENPYPEEMNRVLIGSLADIHLCPTIINFDNLLKEGKINYDKLSNAFIVGNTALDNLVEYKEKCEYTNKILVTLHRRENHEIINEWFHEINELAKAYPDHEFILPLHPNPAVQLHKDLLTNVNIVKPMEHKDLLELLIKTKLVITDSGGLQEECSFLSKKCLVCRKVTERPEAMGYSSFIVKKPSRLKSIFSHHINDYKISYESPYGDGNSAKKIVNILKKLIYNNI